MYIVLLAVMYFNLKHFLHTEKLLDRIVLYIAYIIAAQPLIRFLWILYQEHKMKK